MRHIEDPGHFGVDPGVLVGAVPLRNLADPGNSLIPS